MKDAHFVALCQAIGRPDLGNDPRYLTNPDRAKHETVLRALFREVFLTATTDEWLARLKANDVLGDRINSPKEMLTDPHLKARDAIKTFAQPGLGTVTIPRTSGQPDGTDLCPAPHLGEHTAEILKENGRASCRERV